MKAKALCAVMACGLLAAPAEAALHDRGYGLFYEDVLNVTFTQDGNLSKTLGYSATGKMTWNTAMTWADDLVYAGYSDWRLASARQPISYGPAVYTSEIGYLYHTILGNNNTHSILGNLSFLDADSGLQKTFTNVQASVYWLEEEFSLDLSMAWSFATNIGFQLFAPKDAQSIYAWVVRDGDSQVEVNPVPLPAAFWLFGSAVLGLGGARLRRGKREASASSATATM